MLRTLDDMGLPEMPVRGTVNSLNVRGMVKQQELVRDDM
jgi:hypothetical protein